MNKEEFIYIDIRNSFLKFFSFYIVYIITANNIFKYFGAVYLIYIVFKIVEIMIITDKTIENLLKEKMREE